MTPSKLGNQLVDHDGINEPATRTRRREQMEAILEGERAFSLKLQRVAIAAWAGTLLIPVAGVLGMVAPSRGNDGVYVAFAFVGLLGGLAFVVAILTTMAWLFRSRHSTMTSIEMRLASLEELVERSLGVDREE